jgi:hypothetical protein
MIFHLWGLQGWIFFDKVSLCFYNIKTEEGTAMSLHEEKRKVLEKIQSLDGAIRGSIYELQTKCGKPNCYCARTPRRHTSLMLSFSYKGKTRLVPIRTEQIPEIRARINDYKQLKAAVDELTRINAELLRRPE